VAWLGLDGEDEIERKKATFLMIWKEEGRKRSAHAV